MVDFITDEFPDQDNMPEAVRKELNRIDTILDVDDEFEHEGQIIGLDDSHLYDHVSSLRAVADKHEYIMPVHAVSQWVQWYDDDDTASDVAVVALSAFKVDPSNLDVEEEEYMSCMLTLAYKRFYDERKVSLLILEAIVALFGVKQTVSLLFRTVVDIETRDNLILKFAPVFDYTTPVRFTLLSIVLRNMEREIEKEELTQRTFQYWSELLQLIVQSFPRGELKSATGEMLITESAKQIERVNFILENKQDKMLPADFGEQWSAEELADIDKLK